MFTEEEETKQTGEINPDALEAVFEEDTADDDITEITIYGDDDEIDEIDIAFQANDEGYW